MRRCTHGQSPARSVGCVSYDALAESVELLAGAPFPGHARLSRRVRHLPLALDRDGDVAVTMFLRRGVSGVPLLEVHSLELIDGVWRSLGGSGGPGDEAIEPRPRLAELGSPAVSHGSGGTARTSTNRLWDWAVCVGTDAHPTPVPSPDEYADRSPAP